MAEVEVDTQKRAAEAAKAIREQKARENGNNSSTVVAGIDPILHNNIVADLRAENSALSKQVIELKDKLTIKSNENAEGIGDLALSCHCQIKRDHYM